MYQVPLSWPISFLMYKGGNAIGRNHREALPPLLLTSSLSRKNKNVPITVERGTQNKFKWNEANVAHHSWNCRVDKVEDDKSHGCMSREEVPKMDLPPMQSRGRFRAACNYEIPTELIYVGCTFTSISYWWRYFDSENLYCIENSAHALRKLFTSKMGCVALLFVVDWKIIHVKSLLGRE